MFRMRLIAFVNIVIIAVIGLSDGASRLKRQQTPSTTVWTIPPIDGDDPTLMPPRTFSVVLGPNGGANGYNGITGNPSNPFLPLAWYINQELAPVINVTRGNTYTFNINGNGHGFIITNDPVGGHMEGSVLNGLQVYAGTYANGTQMASTMGDLWLYMPMNGTDMASTSPTFQAYLSTLVLNMTGNNTGVLTFTPDMNTPNTVYYQCWTHSYFGWKILVNDMINSTMMMGNSTMMMGNTTMMMGNTTMMMMGNTTMMMMGNTTSTVMMSTTTIPSLGTQSSALSLLTYAMAIAASVCLLGTPLLV